MTDEPPLLVRHLLGLYAIDVLALGRTSGALAALLDAPGTVADIAERARIDQRNADVWLRAMAAAGHARHEGGRFSINDETAMLLGPDFPLDVGAVLDLTYAAMASPFRQVATAMSTGEGVPSAAFAELGAAAGGVNTRLYRAALVDEWISAAPGLRDRLEAGGRIADLACGNGDAAAIMAGAFPRSVVKGFDPGAPEGAHADVPNLELVAGSAAGVVDEEKFDLVTCLDAFHHLGDVRAAARQVHDVLAPDGVFLIAETAMSGDLDADNDDPFSLIVHAAALLYCMQENLANGGDGVTPSIGLGWVDDALAAAGFSSVTQHESDTGYRIFVATR